MAAAGVAGLIFPLRPSGIRLFWAVYMKHNWYPDFKAGVGVLRWEERRSGWLMEKKGSGCQIRLWGEEISWQKWQSYQLFGSSQTAAHLEHISELENLTRNKGDKGGVVKERGPVWWLTLLLFHSITVFKLCVLLWSRHRASPVFLPLFLFFFLFHSPLLPPGFMWVILQECKGCLFPFLCLFFSNQATSWAFLASPPLDSLIGV